MARLAQLDRSQKTRVRCCLKGWNYCALSPLPIAPLFALRGERKFEVGGGHSQSDNTLYSLILWRIFHTRFSTNFVEQSRHFIQERNIRRFIKHKIVKSVVFQVTGRRTVN